MVRPFRSVSLGVGLVIVTISASAAQALPRAQGAAPRLHVQRTEIPDRRGFDRPMVAYTLFAPSGWRTQGEVEYPPPNGCNPPTRLNWTAIAPDGVGQLQIVPEEQWSFSNIPMPETGCLRAPVQDARNYLGWWAQRNRPGSQVLDFRPRPDMLKGFESFNNTNQGMRSWVDAGEILLAYQVNGKPVREAISTILFLIMTELPSLDPSQRQQLLQGSAAPGFAMRMPEGALDFKMIEALRQSIRSAPEWQRRMNQATAERGRIQMESNRQMAETNRRAVADRSAIIAQTARDVNEIQMGTWQNTSESMDRQQRERVEGIRGVETYNDPHFGGTVQLPNQYQNAWQLKDGSYLLTDDVNFDPARDLGVEGTRLKVTP